MMYQATQVLAAFIGTVAFSVLFCVPRQHYFFCGLTGAVGWAVYLLVNGWMNSPMGATFAAAFVLTVLSRFLSVFCRTPTTVFLLCGIFTLVPGAWIYYTAYYAVIGDGSEAMARGLESLKMAAAIGLAIGATYSIPERVFGWKKKVDIWHENSHED